MGLKKIIKLFNQGNVCVSGLRGTGKDLLFGNVIARRKSDYIANFNYGCKSVYHHLDFDDLNIRNTFRNFLSNDIHYYVYPYPDKADIYVSDAGVYFPSQYSSLLDRDYSSFTNFQALSRHLGDCNFHFNAQNVNRVWNKIREQSDIYINCNRCICLFNKFVIQVVTVYDKYDSIVARVEPYRHIKAPTFADRQTRTEYLARDEVLYRQFTNSYGVIKRHLLIYFNKANYDTRFFKNYLKGGVL